MYSESDIEAAIAAGAITPAAAQALRDSVAHSRAQPAVDEESFRLLTGFNDIFVSIAIILVTTATGWIATGMAAAVSASGYFSALVGGVAVAALSWALAEYFTRQRRMALPSILLLATFAFSVGPAVNAIGQLIVAPISPSSPETSFLLALSALATAGASYLHWRRFRVPITIAALTTALVLTLVFLILAIVPGAEGAWLPVLLVAGVGVFGFAMWWDMSDRRRVTRRSDVAFWLHLTAAPMIAHSLFNLLGVLGGHIGSLTALCVVTLYVLFGVVALAVDRRALLVSSLVYVLYALAGLLQRFGTLSLNIALTGLIIGSALLLLSAFWHSARRAVVSRLSPGLRNRLPELDRPAPSPRPA